MIDRCEENAEDKTGLSVHGTLTSKKEAYDVMLPGMTDPGFSYVHSDRRAPASLATIGGEIRREHKHTYPSVHSIIGRRLHLHGWVLDQGANA